MECKLYCGVPLLSGDPLRPILLMDEDTTIFLIAADVTTTFTNGWRYITISSLMGGDTLLPPLQMTGEPLSNLINGWSYITTSLTNGCRYVTTNLLMDGYTLENPLTANLTNGWRIENGSPILVNRGNCWQTDNKD